MRGRVVVTDWDYPTLDIERGVLERVALELVPRQCRNEDDVIRECVDADGLLNQYAPLTARVLAALTRCRVIARYGVGFDNVDLPAATKLGIAVCNVPDYAVEEVSDHAIALILALARGTHALDRSVRTGVWDFAVVRPLHRMQGRVLGVLGLGRIGLATARKGAALGLRVVACDRRAAEPGLDRGPATMVSFETLLETADFLSVHVPLDPANRHLIDAAALRRMKPDAVLINTARGGVVDSDALVHALREGWIYGAGLDVVDDEPIGPGHPLLGLERVLVTPHAAWYSEDAFVELKTKAAEEVAAVLRGHPPRSCLNPVVLRRSRAGDAPGRTA